MNDNTRQYTWLQIREGGLSMARLDRLYVFKHQLQVVKSCCINHVCFSDHSMVISSVFIRFLKVKKCLLDF